MGDRGDIWICAECNAGFEAHDIGHAAAIHDINIDDHAFVDADSRIVGEDPGYGDIGTAAITAAEQAANPNRALLVVLTSDERAFLLEWMRSVAKVTAHDTELAIAEKIGMALADIEIQEEGR